MKKRFVFFFSQVAFCALCVESLRSQPPNGKFPLEYSREGHQPMYYELPKSYASDLADLYSAMEKQKGNPTQSTEQLSIENANRMLNPIIEEYFAHTSFESKNKFAFRFANRHGFVWSIPLSTFVLRAGVEEKMCIYHLASARFTKQNGLREILNGLEDRNPQIVLGTLEIVTNMRQLDPTGRDAIWPDQYKVNSVEVLKRVIELCKKAEYQEAATAVIRSFEVSPKDAIENKSTQPQDPNEGDLADFLAAANGQDEETVAKQASERALRAGAVDSWSALAYLYDTRGPIEKMILVHLAAPIYRKPGSKERIVEVLNGEDRYRVRGMLGLLQGFLLDNSAAKSPIYFRVRHTPPEDIDYWPRNIGRVLDRNPDLALEVAETLEFYPGVAAIEETQKRLLKLLITDDPVVATRLRSSITRIDPSLAKILDFSISKSDAMLNLMSDSCVVLTSDQRRAVEKHIAASEKPIP